MPNEVFEAQLKFKDNLDELVHSIEKAQQATRRGTETMQSDLDTLSQKSQESLRKGVSGTIDGLVSNIDRAAGRVRKFDVEINSVVGGWGVMMKQPIRTWATLFSSVRLGFRQMTGDSKSFTVGFTSVADAIATASGRFEALKPVATIMGKLAVASERATGFLRTLSIGVRGADKDILMLSRSMSRAAEAAKTMVVAWREQHNQAITAQKDAIRKNMDQIREYGQVQQLIDKYRELGERLAAAGTERERVTVGRRFAAAGAELQKLGVDLAKVDAAYDSAGAKIGALTQKNQAYSESVRVMTGVHKPLIARIASSTGTINTHIQYLAAAMQKTDLDLAKSAGNLERRLHLANQAVRAMAANMERAQKVGLAIPPEQTASFEQAKRNVALLTEELRRRIKVGQEAAASAKKTSRESANAIESGSKRSAAAMRQYASATREATDTNRSLLQYVQPRGMINRGIMQVGARATRASADVGRFSMSMGSIVGMAGAMGGALGKLDPTIAAVTVGVSQMADQAVRSFSAMMSVAGTASEKIKASMAIIANSMMAFGVMAAGLIVKLGMLGAEIETMEITVRQVARNLAAEAGVDMEKAADYVIRLRDEIAEMNITTKEATTILGSFLRAKLPLDQLKGLAQAAKDFGVTVANMSTSEVLGRFNQFIQTGNSMLLKRLGITKTASMMNDEYAESIGKTTAQLTPYEKSMARIHGILEQVKTVQGVYDEAQKTAAKNLSSLKRLFEEAALSIGKRFLPIVTKVIMGIKNLIEWFMALDPSVHDNIAAFIKWTAVIGLSTGALLNLIPAIKAAMKLIMLMGKRMLMLTPQIAIVVAVIGAIGVVVAALKKIWDDNFGGIQDSIKDLLTTLKTEFKPIIDDIIYWFATFGKQIKHIVVLVAQNIKLLVAVISGLVTSLQTKFAPVFDTIRASLNGFMRAVSRVLLTVQSLLRGDWRSAWKHAEAAVVDVLTSIALLFKNTVAKAAVWGWNLIVQLANGVQKAATTVLARVMKWIGNVISRFLAPGSPPAEGPLSHIVEWGRGVMETYLRAFGLADFSLLRDIMSPISQALQDAVSAGTLGEAALPGTIKAVREQVGNLLAEFRRTGEVNEEIMASISESLGEGGRDIMEYIRRLTGHQKALRALQDVQKEYAEAEATGFIPAELKERLKMAEEEAEATKEAVDWQKEFIAAQKETVDLQAQMLEALDKMESALGSAADSMKDAAAAMEDMPFAFDLPDEGGLESLFPEDLGEKMGLGAVSEEWLEMREKIEGVIEAIKDFIALPLDEKLQVVSDFLADVGGKVVTWLEDVTGMDISGWLETFGEKWDLVWDAIQTWATTTWETTIKPKLDDFAAWLDTNLPKALQIAQDAVEETWNWIVEKTKWLYEQLVGKSYIPDTVNETISWFEKLTNWFKTTALFETIEKVANTFKDIWLFIKLVAAFVPTIATVIAAKLGLLGPIFASIGSAIATGETAIGLFVLALKGFAAKAATFATTIAAPIVAIIAGFAALLYGIWENREQLLGFWDDLKEEFDKTWELLKPALEEIWIFVEPIVKAIGAVLGTVVAIITGIAVSILPALWDAVQTILPRIASLFHGVFNIIYGIVKTLLLPAINLIVAAVNALLGNNEEATAALQLAWENFSEGIGLIWSGIVEVFVSAFNGIITFFVSFAASLIEHVATFAASILDLLGMHEAADTVRATFDDVWEKVSTAWEQIKFIIGFWIDEIVLKVTDLYNSVNTTWEQLQLVIVYYLDLIATSLDDFITGGLAGWQLAWENLKIFFDTLWTEIKEGWEWVADAIGIIFDAFVTGGLAGWKSAWEDLGVILDTLWTEIETGWNTTVNAIGTIFDAFITGGLAGWQTAWENLQIIFDVMAAFIKDTFQKAWDDLMGAFDWAVLNVLNPIKTAFDDIATAISDVIQWVKDAIEALKNFEIPSWLTGGSPPPLANWFSDIAGAMQKMKDVDLSSQFSAQMAGLTAQLTAAPAASGARNNFYEGAFTGAFPGVRDGRDGQDLMRQFQTYLENADTRARGA